MGVGVGKRLASLPARHRRGGRGKNKKAIKTQKKRRRRGRGRRREARKNDDLLSSFFFALLLSFSARGVAIPFFSRSVAFDAGDVAMFRTDETQNI